ncbi:MAG: molecular chaperone HtpG [Bacteroidales bacterium]|jgi:molecular chaperone HtpG|nr:molecular chaperone HtpG [Bacteroidales bacterium]NLM92990.1 molecular chaperone HtpG [Bacteroidales bacterium]
MQKGKINVQTENIFPIIKKFLYSDHEIFLRELVSNAVDATQKLRTMSSVGEIKGDLGDTRIEVKVDPKAKTLTVSDRGIGMTAEEVNKYINQIAFSSAEEWIEKYKKQENGGVIIGHFGLGFYSSFMVAKKVEIFSRSYQEGAKAVRWECDGNPEYILEDAEKAERGTDIVLHIADDSQEFLEEGRILGLLSKYCKFLPVEIVFGTEKKTIQEKDKKGKEKDVTVEEPRIINNTKPAWTQKPAELKDEDYKSFYRELYPMSFEEPLFNIHLNVDYPFNLTGILYFPKVKQNFEVQRDKIQLYSNQVFVTDSVEGIVPDFLTLLHGVIDSPDIPLNVSRSFLQSDGNVKKISGHITKKVADKLEELFKNNRQDFEAKWDDIKIFIEYGMISEEKFRERAKKFCLLKNVDNKFFTLEEYENHIKTNQTDKEKKVVHLYATHPDDQHSFVDLAKDRGYDVLLMDTPIDSHFVNLLESELENSSFVRVDSDVIDKLINKEDPLPSKLSDKQKESLQPLIEKQLDSKDFHVSFENLSETEPPMVITQPEFMRRMKDMSMLGGMNYMGQLPDSYMLVVNSNHPFVYKIAEEKDEASRDKFIRQAIDLALLSRNLLKGEKLTAFIKRSVEMI